MGYIHAIFLRRSAGSGQAQKVVFNSMSPPARKGPNPFFFLGLTVLSAASFFVVVKYRANKYPPSEQRRQLDHPLVPPRHKESEDTKV